MSNPKLATYGYARMPLRFLMALAKFPAPRFRNERQRKGVLVMKRIVLLIFVLGIFATFASTQATKEKPQPARATRVAVVNIGALFANFHPWGWWRSEPEIAGLVPARNEARKLMDSMDEWMAAIHKGGLPADRKEEVEKKIRATRLKLDEIDHDTRKLLAKRSEERLVFMWTGIQEAIRTYATKNGIDIVLGYGDPSEKEMLNLFPNVDRKKQAMDSGSTVPLLVSPRLDITEDVIEVLRELRKKSRETRKP
jgi:Skp family chaperone for outer membrane proteins